MAEDTRMMELVGASDLFRLAGALFRYPTPDFVNALADGALLADCQQGANAMGLPPSSLGVLEGAIPPFQGALDAAEGLRQLRREHTRLFGVPGREVLYLLESRYMQDEDGSADSYLMFVNPCSLDVEKMMKAAGFVAARNGEEPLDHISTEMEFVGLLYGKAAAAVAVGDEAEEAHRLQQAVEFRSQHLDRWAVRFCADVQKETENPTYRAFARFATEVLRHPVAAR